MLDQDILSRVQNLMVELFGTERFGDAVIDQNTELFTQLSLKSLELVTLLTQLESTVGLKMPVCQIPITELTTVGDLIRQVPGEADISSGSDPIADSMKRGSRRRRRR